MSKRSIIMAVLAVVLFIAAIFSVVLDFKPKEEDLNDPEPEIKEPTFKEKMAAAKVKKAAERIEEAIQQSLKEKEEREAAVNNAANVLQNG